MADPYDDFLAHEAMAEKWLERLPVCDICGEPIQDEYYYIVGGDRICEHCMESEFRFENEEL